MNFDPAADNELKATLDPNLTEPEREELIETMQLLGGERPTPHLEFIDRLAGYLGLEPRDLKQLSETAELLMEARPLPGPSFRGELARRLSARPAPPPQLRLRIAAYAGSGALLLLLVAVGLAGVGPLAS
jgi:hypothetical protein